MDEFDDGQVCALSGVTPTDEEVSIAGIGDDDSDTPLDWIEITLARRVINPLYAELVEVKAGLVAGLLATIEDPQERESNRQQIELQVEAQFAALEQNPQYTPVITESVVRYLAPTAYAEGLADARNELLESLGLGDTPWIDKPVEAAKLAVSAQPAVLPDPDPGAE
jgi:hypothetical protein